MIFSNCKEFCRAKKRRVPANLLELFIFAKQLVEEPFASAFEAMKGEAANAGMTMADALKRARKKAQNVKVEQAKITQAQGKVKETHTKREQQAA